MGWLDPLSSVVEELINEEAEWFASKVGPLILDKSEWELIKQDRLESKDAKEWLSFWTRSNADLDSLKFEAKEAEVVVVLIEEVVAEQTASLDAFTGVCKLISIAWLIKSRTHVGSSLTLLIE